MHYEQSCKAVFIFTSHPKQQDSARRELRSAYQHPAGIEGQTANKGHTCNFNVNTVMRHI